MNNQTPQRPARAGLLVEDANAIEVTDANGRQSIEKTHDRNTRATEMREAAGSTRPIHPPVNG
jgi:hypothetical protein